MNQNDAGLKRGLGSLTVAALGAVLAVCIQAAPTPRPVAGVVVDLKGKPTLKSAADGKSARVALNQFVYNGDSVKTGTGEAAAIAFVGGAEMRINADSEFVIDSGGGAKPTSVSTKVGQAWTRLLHGKSQMEVHTPLAVAAVRGTEADVDVDQRLSVKVYEGLVDVQNQFGSQSLRAGMMTEVSGAGQAPQAPKTMKPEDYAKWQEDLSPKDLENALKKLDAEAERTGVLNLKFRGKDGTEKSLDLKKGK
ncbi:MAG: FecR domain-containing protein [Elusimicrobia bacterium]|nr:FecR domain-containing protein [Elusimicrobiota bacterium]